MMRNNYKLSKKYIDNGFRLIQLGENAVVLVREDKYLIAFRADLVIDDGFFDSICENRLRE